MRNALAPNSVNVIKTKRVKFSFWILQTLVLEVKTIRDNLCPILINDLRLSETFKQIDGAHISV